MYCSIYIYRYIYTACPTRYWTRNFFNNSNTNEDIATKFEQGYIRCVRNEEEFVCSAPNCCDMEQRSVSQPACFLPDTPLCWSLCHLAEGAYIIRLLLFVSVSVCVSSHRIQFKFRCNILISGKIIKVMLGSVASGTLCSSYTALEETSQTLPCKPHHSVVW